MYRIWFERELPPQYAHLLDGVAVAAGSATTTPEAPLSALPGAHAVIASARIRYNGEFFEQFPSVRVVSRTGIGLDNITLADATAHNVAVCYAPDGPTISTSEHAITLMLATAKEIKRCERDLADGGRRDFFNEYQGAEVHGLQLGLLGLGRIGSRVAAVARALGMRVVAYDPWVGAEQAAALGVELASSVEAVLETSDIISLHLPLTEKTRHIINAERLARMKPGGYLINTARGGLVDEAALVAALDSGHLRGAGLDVYSKEPPDPSSPLLNRVDVIATPHIAGATPTSRERLWHAAILQALQVLQGIRPPNLANPEVWPLTGRTD